MPIPKTQWEWITATLLVTAFPAALMISCGAAFGLIGAAPPGTRLADGLRAMFIGAALGGVIGLVVAIRGLFRWTAEDQRFVLVCVGVVVAVMLGIVMWMDRIGRW